jgi:hypothetical protein
LQQIAGAIAAAVLATFVVATPKLWLAGALATAAWLLLADRRPAEPALPAPGPAPPTDRATPTDVVPNETAADEATETAARWGRTRRGMTEPLRALRLRPTRDRASKREPALWPLTLALLVTFAVVCLAIDNSTEAGLDPAIFVNGALVIIGGVLALSGWRGRAGWTILLAVPLIPLWIAFSAADIGRYEGTGSRSVDVLESPDDGRLSVEHGYGDLDIFISEQAIPAGETLELTTAMTAGTTTIAVPDNASILIRSRAGIGFVDVDGAGPAWRTDNATVISHLRQRRYSPVTHECFTEQYSPSEMQNMYREWNAQHGTPSTIPDFTDPEAIQLVDVQEFLSMYLPPETRPIDDGDAVVWTASWDDTGRPCDPDEPAAEAGTVEIDATIGLGKIHVVRHT